MKLTGLLGLLFILSSLFSCVKNNPDPVWIKIDKWQLEANPLLSGGEGDLIHNFSDAYVYVDNKLMGIFELPIKIPVLISGENKKIMIYPAIRNNGIAATKKMYPFCEPYIITTNMVKNETVSITPVTRYYSIAKFSFVEDFESAGIKFITDTTSKTTLQQIPHTDPGKTGHCGHVAFTLSDSIWTAYTHATMVLPKGGAEVYLEIEYKATNGLLTGVLAITLPNALKINKHIQLNPQEPSVAVWRKTYIDLKEIVSSSTTASYFEQYLQAVIDPGKTSSDIYIDNIKVIHF